MHKNSFLNVLILDLTRSYTTHYTIKSIKRYCEVKNFGRLVPKNMFGRENIGGLSIRTKESKGWWIRVWYIDQQLPNSLFSTAKVFLP